MAVQYFCKRRQRRQAVREHATLNGIDYLEVLDLDAPAGSPRQRTLLVQLLKPLDGAVSFTAVNAEIRGGVRIRPIGVEWAARASGAATLFGDGLVSAAERDLLLERDQPDAGALLVVRTDATGDFSTYVLALVDDDAPLATLDPPLAEVEFSFKVECPSEFDCAPDEICPPTPQTLPPIDYLARDYASFRRLMLDRLSVVMPDWKERSPADLGVALVEVLAYAADRMSYYQDGVATEAYLGTARRRPSVRRHARLLDYRMHDGVNARVWVAFRAEPGVQNVVLPRSYLPGQRTRMLTKVPGFAPLLDEETYEEMVAEHRPQVFELLHDLTLFHVHNRIRFYTWGDDACCLPAGATRATLRDAEAARLLLRPGDVLVFEEVKGPGTSAPSDADPAQRHAVRLARVTPSAELAADGTRSPGPLTTDELFGQPVVEIEWGTEDALPFPLCISVVVTDEDDQETLVRDVSVAHGNVALADHGRSLAPEPLPPPTGDRWYRPRLLERPVTQAVHVDAEIWARTPPGEQGGASAAQAHRQDPRQALPAVTLLDEEDDEWRPEHDLLGSDRFDPDFVAEVEDDGGVRLRFGDDVYARRPLEGGTLEARYRVGTGTAGNVGAGAVYHLLTTSGLGIDVADPVLPGIRNPLPAVGGTGAESLDEVRLYAPQAFRRQERAVTEADYAEVSERHPEVSRAVARRLWTGSWHTMFITVDRLAGREVDDAFESELGGWVDRYELAGHDVEIEPPRFVALDIALTVCVKRRYFGSDVKRALLEVFSSVDLPGGRRGYFHPDSFSFGQPVYLSRIIARAMDVPGVRWVEVDPSGDPPARFQRWGELPRGEIGQGFIDIGRLEIARLDNDPNAPENGRIEFHMEGGS
jgi:hypothetical protein